jgi:hypothetical protein
MRKHDEQRREAVVGMHDRRERFRRRDELDRAFGLGRYEGREVVLRGTPEQVVAAVLDVPGVGAEFLDIVDGCVVRGGPESPVTIVISEDGTEGAIRFVTDAGRVLGPSDPDDALLNPGGRGLRPGG